MHAYLHVYILMCAESRRCPENLQAPNYDADSASSHEAFRCTVGYMYDLAKYMLKVFVEEGKVVVV